MLRNGSIKPYVKAIGRFFNDDRLAIGLLTGLERYLLETEATDRYYSDIKAYRVSI